MSDATRHKVWLIAKSVVFTAGALALVGAIGFAVRPSVGTTNGWPTVTDRDAKVDVLFVGTSRTYCAIMPLEMWRTRGISAADLTGPIQTIPISRAYVEQAFMTQKPRIVFLDLCMLGKNDTLTLDTMHGNLDLMPAGIPRTRAILHVAKPADWSQLLLPFELYHSRWAELNSQDLSPDKHAKFGFARGAAYWPASTPLKPEVVIDKVERAGYRDDLVELKSIAETCRKNGARLVLYAAPNPRPQQVDGVPVMNRLRADLAGDFSNVDYLDLNAPDVKLGVDPRTDYLDEHHLNHSGAVKTSRWLADYLARHYQVEDRKRAPVAPALRDELAQYDREFRPVIPPPAPSDPTKGPQPVSKPPQGAAPGIPGGPQSPGGAPAGDEPAPRP